MSCLLTRVSRSLSLSGVGLGLALACSSESPSNTGNRGGAQASGGAVAPSGGTAGSGGQDSGGIVTGGTTSGGMTSTGGSASTGGNTHSGGSSNTGGATISGGVSNTGGASMTGGKSDTGGKSGGGSTSTGGTATTGGSASTGGSGGGSAHFSFFMTSQAGLQRLSANAKGFGGDLKFGKADGLSGADEICRQLAESSMPGNNKTWRAFLSVTKGPAGTAVNAIDRVGEGPWYDRTGRVLATTKAALLNTRPQGADPAILNDLPNEDGVPNHDPGTGVIDNHNVLTGSTTMGTLDGQGLTATCQDWTSSVSNGGRPVCGVSWPRGTNIIHWISELNEGGCAPGATEGGGAQSGPSGTVGALGGYGGFYCFALTP